MQKYSVNQQLIQTLLSWVESGEIAIPEIQRPFIWDSSKVRDLMDSLYQGFPIGYVISWQNPDINTKRKLMAAIDNINASYRGDVIKLASAGMNKHWKMRQEKRSKRYTTHWTELAEVI